MTDVWPEHQVQQAAGLIRQVFLETEERGSVLPAELTRALEAALEAPRGDWPTGLCRRLWDFLAEAAEGRKRSPAHQTRWYHLVGWCLRPGFGDPLDRFRVEQLWKMLAAPPRAEASKPGVARVPDAGADYWIMWRRLSGGLNATLQQSLFDRLRPVLLPVKGKATVKPNLNELAEMWRAAASLERLDVKHKEALGTALLKPLRRSPVPTYGFWSLTRLGARALIYGPLNAVVHQQVVEGWLDAILAFEPGNESERMGWAFCLAQLARRTGQRALDIDDSHRASVLTVLKGLSVPRHWLRMVEEVMALEQRGTGADAGRHAADRAAVGADTRCVKQCVLSANPIVCQRPHVLWLKAQHNVVPGDAGRHHLLADFDVGAVVLDPHLAVTDVDVDDRAMNAAAAVPTHLHDLVVIVLAVHDRFRADVAVHRLVAGIFFDQTPHDVAVTV